MPETSCVGRILELMGYREKQLCFFFFFCLPEMDLVCHGSLCLSSKGLYSSRPLPGVEGSFGW